MLGDKMSDKFENSEENARFIDDLLKDAEQLNEDNQPDPKHYFIGLTKYCEICGRTGSSEHLELPTKLKFQAS